MEVIDRLNTKRTELNEREAGLWQGGGSKDRELLQYKIKKIDKLITAYENTSIPLSSQESEIILNQHIGFEKQKEEFLNNLKTENFCAENHIQKKPPIIYLTGPAGVGKTSFAKLLAQAAGKKSFVISLGGVSDASFLTGSETDIGWLAEALINTNSRDLVIILDEGDKIGPSFKTTIHECLSSILDSVQNQEILDNYLGVKLDFSHITFIITTNNQKKIPDYLISRLPETVELTGYTTEQKKEIANKFIQKWFKQNSSLNQNNLEITPIALEILISKTKEKGVRQLEKALDKIFGYCLLQWAQAAIQGSPESKIKIDSDLVHQIIPQNFPNVDQTEEEKNFSENKREKKELEILRKELAALKEEKGRQTELKAIRFNSLLVLRQIRKNLTEKEFQNYEGKINVASSREEIEIIVKEFLLKTNQQKKSSPQPANKDKSNKNWNEWAEIKRQNEILIEQIRFANSEIEKLKGERQNSQTPNQENKDKALVKTLVIIIIIASIIWGIYGIFKLLMFLTEQKKKKKKKQ